MKPEPLTKEKIFRCVEKDRDEGYRSLLLNDVKSAVDLVLKEIEKEKKNYKEKQEWKDKHQEFYEGVWHGLEITRVLIKKAFEGVIE